MEGLKHLIDYGIIGLLIALSLWAVAVATERWLYFRRVDVRRFQNEQEFEVALTKRPGRDRHRCGQRPIYRSARNRARDHVDVS
jgi:hypothetical protein